MIEITEPSIFDPPSRSKATLSNNTYDVVKKIVQLGLPAMASLYFGLAQIWGLPYGEEIVGSLALIATFLGVVLGISSHNYQAVETDYDGHLVVMTNEEGSKIYSLELDGDPEDLTKKKTISFKVHPGIELE